MIYDEYTKSYKITITNSNQVVQNYLNDQQTIKKVIINNPYVVNGESRNNLEESSNTSKSTILPRIKADKSRNQVN